MCEDDSVQCDTPPLPTAIGDLSAVLEAVSDLNEWIVLGLKLGLLYPTLEKIDNDHPNKTETCKMKMLAAWLQQEDDVPQKGVPSWSMLQAGLRKMGKNELASGIMVSYEYNY